MDVIDTQPADDVRANRVVLDHRSDRRGSIGDWVNCFAEVWSNPRQDLGRFMALLAPEIVLRAPTFPPKTVGQAAGLAAFQRAFAAMPDLTATVRGWSASADTLFIEMTFQATIGGRRVAWDNIDRFRFRRGSAIERVAYFDPSPVRRAFLRNFKGFAQYLRLRAHRP